MTICLSCVLSFSCCFTDGSQDREQVTSFVVTHTKRSNTVKDAGFIKILSFVWIVVVVLIRISLILK